VERKRAEGTVTGASTDERPGEHGPSGEKGRKRPGARDVRLDLQARAWQALEEEAHLLKMTVEEVVGFSVLYYLADRDSGRIARRHGGAGSKGAPSTGDPSPGKNPLEKLLGP
jgi:hypothetical protein